MFDLKKRILFFASLFTLITLACLVQPGNYSYVKSVKADVSETGIVHVAVNYWRGADKQATLVCLYPGEDGISILQHTSVDLQPSTEEDLSKDKYDEFTFIVKKDGLYPVTCAIGQSSPKSGHFTIEPTTDRRFEIDEVTVKPEESDGKQALTLYMKYTNGTETAYVSCSYTNPSGAEIRLFTDKPVKGTDKESSGTEEFPITVSQPGNYTAHCWDQAGPAQKSSSFTITAPDVTLNPTLVTYVGGFAGVWDTNWGEMTCSTNGLAVHCEYTHDQGRIDATLSADGRTMEGQWSESPSYSPPKDAGRVTLTLSADGNTISGDWWYGQDTSGGAWTGTRK